MNISCETSLSEGYLLDNMIVYELKEHHQTGLVQIMLYATLDVVKQQEISVATLAVKFGLSRQLAIFSLRKRN
jgi:hypothetical protein